jgi:exodeoxyribonuclease VII large subunit
MSIPAARLDGLRVVYSVSRLNREARFVLNECFGGLWVEGEISNLSMPASGHLYFTLKDAEAQVRCAMFRPQVRALPKPPRNGDHVQVLAQVGLYEPRGDFQLVVEALEAAGDGALLQAFEALKRRLAAEGLFDAARKRPVPALPRCVGVIASPTGAAVRDVLTVLRRRCPSIPVIVFPAKAQGSEAKHEIAAALEQADRSGLCDVLILARGGGSLEDLWAYNEECVARAIDACKTPVIAGIGHEIDFTIADLAADLRAATPSAAAEAASPDRAEWLERFQRLESRLVQGLGVVLERQARRLDYVEQRLQRVHPQERLGAQSQRLDEWEARLARAWQLNLEQARSRLDGLDNALRRHDPETRIDRLDAERERLEQRLAAAIQQAIASRQSAGAALAQRLHALSPLATLARGYAIARDAATGRILHGCGEVQPGDRLAIRLPDGEVLAVAEAVHKDGASTGTGC